jgi:hypothetical protein
LSVATALEQAFIAATAAALQVRQTTKDAALKTYAFIPANLAAYRTALVAADVAYQTAVNTASTTAGITPLVVPETPGCFGGTWASVAS